MASTSSLAQDTPFVLQVIAAALALIPAAFLIYGVCILIRKLRTALLVCLYDRRLAARRRQRSAQADQLDLEAAHLNKPLDDDSGLADNAPPDMDTELKSDFFVPLPRAYLRSAGLSESQIEDLCQDSENEFRSDVE